MNLLRANSYKYNPEEQLELLKLQCTKLSPVLYRVNAQYLEYVRSILPDAVRRAIFLLITEHTANLSEGSSLDSRKLCLETIDKLVSNAIEFITIEQLMKLSDEIEKDSREKLRNKQKDLLDSLNTNESDNRKSNIMASIIISPTLPLEDPSIVDRPFLNDSSLLNRNLSFETDLESHLENYLTENKDSGNEQANKKEPKHTEKFGMEVIKRLFLNTGKSVNKKDQKGTEIDQTEAKTNASFNPEDGDNFLGDNPIELIRWMNSLETALIRRLRNLSNAINLELLGAGLINNLIPVSLLDAAVSGQIITKDAPSNLLKLNLPINDSISDAPIDIVCLLVRPSELEFDHTKLSKTKSLLNQYRNSLLEMTTKYRHWHSRLLADEVSNQWFRNSSGGNRIGQKH